MAACGGDDTAGPEAKTTAPTTRTYAGGYGPVELPLRPSRVVSIYETDSDVALVLGLPLVGAGSRSLTAFAPYQADRMGGVQPLGSLFGETNYERIAAMRPDLVVHLDGLYVREQREPLLGIAPVLALSEAQSELRWRDRLREVGGALDRAQAAEAFVVDDDRRATALRERVQARWAGATIAYVGPMDAGQFYVAQQNMQMNEWPGRTCK